MRNKLQVFVFLLVIFFVSLSNLDAEKIDSSKLEMKLTDIKNALIANEIVLSTLKKTNEENKSLTAEQIRKLDEEWQNTDGIRVFVISLSINDCSKELLNYQENNLEFAEIFISDSNGLNACQTNKTSDYYQADEQWWVDTYNEGKGKAYYGQVEYDDSAEAKVIPLYMPVEDKGEVVGIIKAVVKVEYFDNAE